MDEKAGVVGCGATVTRCVGLGACGVVDLVSLGIWGAALWLCQGGGEEEVDRRPRRLGSG
jgi:hypothetical protein